MTSYLPEILDPSVAQDAARLQSLKAEGALVVDTYDEQLKELAEISDPSSPDPHPIAPPGERYAYIPWRRTLVRIVDEEAYATLRTNRNRELLTAQEQERFANAHVAFAGLNVGNPGAVCIALEGGSRRMKLADLDPLSLTNLNRFRAGLADLGVNKAVLTARQILEVDPYYRMELFENGLTPDNLGRFLDGTDLLVEEMDALPLKVAVREAAKEKGIPVIMVTGNGEGVLLDVERYDQDPDLPLLNGLLEERVRAAALSPESARLSRRERAHLARDFMGKECLDARLLDSFEAFGVTLAGIPQLAESSFLRGAAICYAAKAIILGRDMPSGRYSFSFSDHLTRLG